MLQGDNRKLLSQRQGRPGGLSDGDALWRAERSHTSRYNQAEFRLQSHDNRPRPRRCRQILRPIRSPGDIR